MLQHITRINQIIIGKFKNESWISHLGKFGLVCSTFSLHHWNIPAQAPQAAETHEPSG